MIVSQKTTGRASSADQVCAEKHNLWGARYKWRRMDVNFEASVPEKAIFGRILRWFTGIDPQKGMPGKPGSRTYRLIFCRCQS